MVHSVYNGMFVYTGNVISKLIFRAFALANVETSSLSSIEGGGLFAETEKRKNVRLRFICRDRETEKLRAAVYMSRQRNGKIEGGGLYAETEKRIY
jgi:glutamine amidotransferase-like uncharacterized protein